MLVVPPLRPGLCLTLAVTVLACSKTTNDSNSEAASQTQCTPISEFVRQTRADFSKFLSAIETEIKTLQAASVYEKLSSEITKTNMAVINCQEYVSLGSVPEDCKDCLRSLYSDIDGISTYLTSLQAGNQSLTEQDIQLMLLEIDK
jgi:hypothetical protein